MPFTIPSISPLCEIFFCRFLKTRAAAFYRLYELFTRRFWTQLQSVLFGECSHTSKGQLCVHVQSLQSCPTLCNPMDCSPPGSSIYGISHGQEPWSGLPFPSPGDLPDPGIKPASFTSPALAGGFFITSATAAGCLSYNQLSSVCLGAASHPTVRGSVPRAAFHQRHQTQTWGVTCASEQPAINQRHPGSPPWVQSIC